MLNKNATPNREDIVLSDLPSAGTPPRSCDFPACSLTALSIPDDGGPMRIWSYTKAMADAGQPHQQLQ